MENTEDLKKSTKRLTNTKNKLIGEIVVRNLSDHARKNRKWLITLSFSLLIWCYDIQVKKVSIVGVELESVQQVVPLALLSAVLYFLILFISYAWTDYKHYKLMNIEYGKASLELSNKVMGAVHNLAPYTMQCHLDGTSASGHFGEVEFLRERMVESRSAEIRIIKSNKVRMFMDLVFPLLLAAAAIATFGYRSLSVLFISA